MLLCFLLIDALCGQRDALRGALFGLLLSLFSLCGGGNGSCSSYGGSNSGKRRSYRGALGGLVFLRSSAFSHEVLNFRVLNLGSGCYRCGGLLFGFYRYAFFDRAFFRSRLFRSGGIEDQLGGVLLFSLEVLSLERLRDGHFVLLLNGHSGEQLGLFRDRAFFLSKFRCQQLGRLNDSLNRLFLNSGSRLSGFCYNSGEVNGFFSFSGLKNFGCFGIGNLGRLSSLGIFGSFSGVCYLSGYLISSSFFSDYLIGSDLAEGLLFAVEGDAQACRVDGSQVVQTGVLCLGGSGAGAGGLRVFTGQGVLGICGCILCCSLRYRMSVLRLFFDYLNCGRCSRLSFFASFIFRLLGAQSTQVLLKLGTCILCSVLRFLNISRGFLRLNRCTLSFSLFAITQERGGSRLGVLSNRGGIFFNVLCLSYLFNLNRLLRFLGESAKRSQQTTTLLLLSLFLSQLISSGRFFNLLIAVQEGTLEILNSAVLFVLLFVVVLVACAFRLHELAQGVLPLLLFHNLLAQSRTLGNVFACLLLLDLSSFGALFFARLFIQLLLADSKEAHWVSSSAGNFLQHPREVFAAHGLLDQHDGVLTQLGAGRVLKHGGFQVGIHDRGHAADVFHTRLHTEGYSDLLNHFVQKVACLAPHLNVQAAHGASQVALGGDSVGRNAGTDLPPGNQHARTHVGTAGQHGGNLHGNLAHGVDEVFGQVRAGSMAAVAAQMNLDGVRCAGNRTDAGTNLTQVHLRIAMQGKSTRNVLEQTLRNHLHRTAG